MQTAPFQLATPFDGPAPAQPSSNRPAQAGAGVNGLSGEAGGGLGWAGGRPGLGRLGSHGLGWRGYASTGRTGLGCADMGWPRQGLV